MAVDLARLGIEINSTSAITANQRLARLATTGAATEKKMVSLATSSRALNGRLAVSAERFQQLGATAKKIGRTLSVALTVPLLGVGAASAKVASEFETELTKINTLVGLSAGQVAEYRTDVLELSQEVGRGARELSRALFTVTSAGARGAEAMEILEQAGKASAIGLGDTQEIARATTAILQAYGKENISAARATEILTSTVREGNLEASDLAPVIGRVLGIAKQLGISFEEVGANIATFTRLGVGAEEAVVGLRGVMNALIKPTSQGEEALAKVGLTFADLRKQVERDGLAETMRGLVEAFDGNDEALGRVIPNVRALSNVLGTAGAQGEAYTQILNGIENGHGIVEEGFKTVGETAAQQWNEAKAALEAAAIELGESTVPMMQELVSIVQGAADWFNSLDDSTQRLITRWGLLAAAIGPVLIIVGKLVSVMPTLIGLVGTLNGLIMANPWVAAATAIGAVATLLAGRYLSATDDATEATNEFEEAMQGSTKSVKEATAALEGLTLQEMLRSTSRGIDITREKMDGLTRKLREDFERVKSIGADAGRTFQEFVEFRAEGFGEGPAAELLALQEQLRNLKEQKKLIPELNKLEVGRANILGNVGGEMERLSAFAREQIRKDEERIDLIRVELGLSRKYTEEVEKQNEATEQTNQNVESIVGNMDEFLAGVPDAQRVIEPIKLMEEIMLGFPVSINQAESALATLQARFNSAVSPQARENLLNYIKQLEEIIAKMKGVKDATEDTGEQTDETTKEAVRGWERVKRAWEDSKGELTDIEIATRDLEYSFESAFEEAIIGGERLGRVLQGLWEDIQRMVLRQTVTQPIAQFLSSFLGSYFGNNGQQTQNAHGGIFTGITESGNRQQFGEAGMEAVLPVARTRNGDLGVKTSGGMGGNVEVNIINYSGEDVETKEQRTNNGGKKIDVMIGQAVAEDIRRGGPVYRAIRDTTTANRNTRRT